MIARNEQRTEDTWDLSGLVKSPEEWDKGMRKLSSLFRKAGSFRGTLSSGPDALHATLSYYKAVSMEAERIGSWAFLSYEADSSNPDVQKRMMMSMTILSLPVLSRWRRVSSEKALLRKMPGRCPCTGCSGE